jgi:hypothetical protein
MTSALWRLGDEIERAETALLFDEIVSDATPGGPLADLFTPAPITERQHNQREQNEAIRRRLPLDWHIRRAQCDALARRNPSAAYRMLRALLNEWRAEKRAYLEGSNHV